MKRRKFLKFLALIPALPIACQGWPFKPKSKPPPIDRYNPDDPITESFFYNGKKYPGKFVDYHQQVIYVGEAKVWIDPGRIECNSIAEAVKLLRKA